MTRDFGIEFLRNTNNHIVGTMKEVCLSTKISKEDSLVLVTSLFRENEEIITEPVILLTNDSEFCKFANSSKDYIGDVLAEEGLQNPGVEYVSTVGKVANCGKVKNLTQDIDMFVADYLTACVKNFSGTITLAIHYKLTLRMHLRIRSGLM